VQAVDETNSQEVEGRAEVVGASVDACRLADVVVGGGASETEDAGAGGEDGVPPRGFGDVCGFAEVFGDECRRAPW